MKHSYVLAAFLSAASLPLGAQITITDADMPAANDTVRLSYALTVGSVDYHLTGPAYLWDFSSLVPSAQQLVNYETPTAFPFNFTATFGVYNISPDSLPVIGTVPSDFYDYYKVSSSSYRQVGQSFMFNFSFAIPVIYNNADYVYRFPMNPGNVDSCDYDYGFSIPGFGYFGQDGHRHNEVDGWGTLVTPFGSFQTLRVKSILNITDTVSLDTTGNQGFAIQRPTLTEYKWLALGGKAPILQIDVQDILSNEVVTGVYYQDSIRDSVFQISVPEYLVVSSAEVFPNPASDFAVLRYDLKQASDVSFRLYDLGGRLIDEIKASTQFAGTHIQRIPLEKLESGMYILQLKAGDHVLSRRICKQ
ncbi:MAG: hypothetical protein FD123_3328 [Bacteroidetes bacterium]|nr:MAG: hypothetical protein FD123_3328 [Bacteroidota bacterium]